MNWQYFLIGLIRRWTPHAWLYSLMERRGNTSLAESGPERYFFQWYQHLQKRGVSLEGKHVLEIGSGRYARAALHTLSAGARQVTLIDMDALALNDPRHQAILEKDCRALGLDWMDASARIDVIRGDFMNLNVPEASRQVDLVTSAAVLEHVRDPGQIFWRCWQWLRSGGVTFHFVDARDHNLSYRYPFEMLTYADKIWENWLDLSGGFHLNRWRAPDYLNAIRQAGFEQVTMDVAQENREALATVRRRLLERYRAIPDDILSIATFYLYAEKPKDC